jgi:hypothetical protein
MNENKINVASQIIEKLLVNLRVLSQISEGDKLEFTAQGNFIPQKPEYWTSMYRFVKRIDRWYTLEKIQDTVSSAEIMEHHNEGVDQNRIENALKLSVHGLRNLQLTYKEDTLFFQSIEVLLERIANRYKLKNKDMI